MLLEVGQVAPDFELPDADGKIHKLSDYRGQKIVLYFYPRDNTAGCTKEAVSFRDHIDAFKRHGVVVLGVSPDTPESHRKFAEKYGLNFTLLSDPEHKVLEAYGVWQEKNMYGKKKWGVKRTTYIIDENGVIQHVFKKVNTAIHAEEVLQALGLSGD